MEQPAATSDENASLGGGPVLCIPPLRVMSPAGGQPVSPLPRDPQGISNGVSSETPRQKLQPVRSIKPKPSAVRDFPEGVGRNAPKTAVRDFPVGVGRIASKQDTGPEVRLETAPEGNATDASLKGSKPAFTSPRQRAKKADLISAQPQDTDVAAEPTSTPDVTPRNRKRNSKSTTPKSPPSTEVKKTRRSAGKGSRPSSAGLEGMDSTDSRRAVQATLRLYDAFRRNLMHQEEIKGKDAFKGRADLNAGTIINSKGLSVNRNKKVIGPVPGVEVGDLFFYRMEIGCIGMHGPVQAGIDYLTAKESNLDTPAAISIISSGGYDDRDDGEELIYTGQGGKSSVDNKTGEDQKLERGNLAMDGSKNHDVAVRVIRGIKDAASPTGKIYTYDGLYKVETSWSERGKAGFEEFKFKLKRMPDQPELGSALIKLANQLKHKPALREGLLEADISKKIENVPVCVVNTVDDEQSPASFEYSIKVQYSPDVGQLELPESCECKGACKTSKGCLCFSKNGSEFAYISSGLLVKEKEVIYECGSHCKCAPTCRNRVTQKGLKYHLEIFKTENRGWGVRSWDLIPAGSFICQYTGKAIDNVEDWEDMNDNEYILNVKRVSRTKSLWGDVSSFLQNQASDTFSPTFTRPDLLLDASQIGNVARFINHSCSPNLLAQCVFHDHHDPRFPHIMLFAMDNIPPLRELTLDYGSDEMGESGIGSYVRSKDCLCGSSDCRGKFYY